MKISIYTIVRNGLYFDYHIVQMLKHHLPFADEIIINEGYSTDGTYEKIKNLDPKIKIFRNEWDLSGNATLYAEFKERARKQCAGDWCILLDCDEFIPEWEFDNIRERLKRSEENVFSMRYVHFYGNYRVYHDNPQKVGWVLFKQAIHRNMVEMEVWGDGSNVRLKGHQNEPIRVSQPFECHHFGFVRHPARLRQKWRIQHKLLFEKTAKWDKTPGVVFDLLPHDWLDKDFIDNLAIYEGPVIKTVEEEPSEFIRDDMLLYNMLLSQKTRQ